MVRTVARAFNSMTSRLAGAGRSSGAHLMADIAHELRTPLAVMQGRLEGMLDGVYPRDEAQIAAVLEETRMLARLVEDLRTLAHAESGTLALQKESTDLGVLINEAASIVRGAKRRERQVHARRRRAAGSAARRPRSAAHPRSADESGLERAASHAAGGAVSVDVASARRPQ